jgi:hypothetical protein
MLSLILTVCLAAAPDTCQEERPPVEPASAVTCMMQGQEIAAEWLNEHPKWVLSAWRCEDARGERPT